MPILPIAGPAAARERERVLTGLRSGGGGAELDVDCGWLSLLRSVITKSVIPFVDLLSSIFESQASVSSMDLWGSVDLERRSDLA